MYKAVITQKAINIFSPIKNYKRLRRLLHFLSPFRVVKNIREKNQEDQDLTHISSHQYSQTILTNVEIIHQQKVYDNAVNRKQRCTQQIIKDGECSLNSTPV